MWEHVGRRWEALSDTERTQLYGNPPPSVASSVTSSGRVSEASTEEVRATLPLAPSPPLAARSAAASPLDDIPERPAPPAPAPTPAPAIDHQSVEPLIWGDTDQQCNADNAGAACDVAVRAAPSIPSGLEGFFAEASSDMVRLEDLADVTELLDDEVVVALNSQLGYR